MPFQAFFTGVILNVQFTAVPSVVKFIAGYGTAVVVVVIGVPQVIVNCSGAINESAITEKFPV